MGWHRGLLIGFDLETTGTDPRDARIVTAAVVEMECGEPVRHREWLADPGVDIPEEAVAIHGVTNERAAAEGRPACEVVEEIAATLVGYWSTGVPVVAYNAAFDLTMLAAELRRHGLRSLPERLGGGEVGPIVDPYTIDRAVDRYRKGKRTLVATCGEYGVVLSAAHQASADAIAAVRVACAVAERHARVAELEPWALHRSQVSWYARWAASYQKWLRQRDPEAVVDGSWPLRVLPS
ncbi:3'-5' exonuclease [Streptomyces sp. NPDC047108]|uniref:3'-5' exonuclease n=1 Tax=Streptomyces sp. NPDC047108 TaxID=3155025 RepID=UPI0033C2C6C2